MQGRQGEHCASGKQFERYTLLAFPRSLPVTYTDHLHGLQSWKS